MIFPPNYQVVTARQASKRLKGKNMLPVCGVPLQVRSIHHGLEAGLKVIVTTDIIELLDLARDIDKNIVRLVRPPELTYEITGKEHEQSVQHQMRLTCPDETSFVLLQPTSPFREQDILKRCLEISGSARMPVRTIYGGHLAQHQMFDGNILINRVEDGFKFWNGSVDVANTWINSCQVDTKEDYDHQLYLCKKAQELQFFHPLKDKLTTGVLAGLYYESLGYDVVYTGFTQDVDKRLKHFGHSKNHNDCNQFETDFLSGRVVLPPRQELA